MANGNQTRRISIKVDTKEARGLQEIAQHLGYLNRNTKSLAGNMSFLTNAFRGWLGFLGVRELMRMSDSMQLLTNRMKVFTGSTEGALDALKQIEGIADRTNKSIQDVGQSYTRMAVALRSYGATTSEITALTEALINTFRIAGASSTETTNTMIQLSQAFASAELRGQELRSVMEQNATLADMLRKVFGRKVYEDARKGLITVDQVLILIRDNMTKINAEAKELTPTMGESIEKSFNRIAMAVNDVNIRFGVSKKFADILSGAINRLGSIALAVAGVALVALATNIKAATAAMVGFISKGWMFVVANPYVAAFAAIAAIVVLLTKNLDDLWDKIRSVGGFLVSIYAEFKQSNLNRAMNSRKTLMNPTGGPSADEIAKRQAEIDKLNNLVRDLATPTASDKSNAPADPVAEMNSLIKKMQQEAAKELKEKKIKELFAEINKEFSKSGDVDKYVKAFNKLQLEKIRREFRDGKTDLFSYSEAMRDFNLRELDRQFAQGTITLEAFNLGVANNKLYVLDQQLKAGRISLEQYNAELVKLEDRVRVGGALEVGTKNYINSVGAMSENIAKHIETVFNELEKSFIDFTNTGKFNFKQFAKAVLDDLQRIIVRSMIIKPLAEGLLNFGAGSTATSTTTIGGGTAGPMYAQPTFAKGGVFGGGNVIPFAKGGVVNSATGFSFGGKMGVMGEAGPEAIIPLRRSGTGELGVGASITPVTVNVINQTGAEVETRESTGPSGEKTIEVLIHNKVRDGIASGAYDKSFKTAFGLNRRGS